MMKRRMLCILLLLSICMVMCGCSKKADKVLNAEEVETNTIMIGSDGSIQSAIVESFDKDYYKQDELEAFIKKEIDSYNANAGSDVVVMNSLQIVEGTVRVVFQYKDIASYAQFNNVEAKLVTMEEAITAGMLPDLLKTAKDNQTVAKSEAEKNKKLKVAVISESLNVTVNGNVKYFSEGALLHTDTVQTNGENDSVIIYQ